MVRFVPPVSQAELAQWYAAATLVACRPTTSPSGWSPSRPQATGTPVVAAAVGGLTTVVRDGHSGLLVEGHDTERLGRRAATRARGRPSCARGWRPARVEQAGLFSWDAHRRGDLARLRPRPLRIARGGSCETTRERRPPRDLDGRTELEYDEARPGMFSFALPGEKKLQTPVRLDVGTHALGVHAFVCRKPDENHERVYRWLLQRNLKLYAVAFAVDRLGDIYLDAPAAAVGASTTTELDRLLGSVLTTADESFNTILELGFASSIRKEWEWRTLRGESTQNLEAFRGWLEVDDDLGSDGPARTRPAPVAPARPGSGG